MDASMYTNLNPQAQQATGLKFSSVVRLAMAAGAVLALTYTGVNYIRAPGAPALKATALYEAGEYGAPENLMAVRFEGFMEKFGKNYPTAEEMALRFEIYKDNARFVQQQNAAGNTFTLGENEYMDLTHEEFTRNYLGLDLGFFQNYAKEGDIDESLNKVDKKDLPPSLDWREKGCVTEVKNQGQCGSCWAFAATGALEGAYCAAGHGSVDISEQQLVDCSKKQGNAGCRGGLMTQAFQYVMDNKGICSESDYPYKGAVARLPFFGACKAKKCKNVMKIEGFSAVPKNSDDALTAAIALKGSIAVAIQADERAFQFYKSGVFSAPCGTNLNHGVLAVGYGNENGQDYLIVKNSWGGSWGDKGYIKFARGSNINNGQGQCGVNMWPVFPKVSKA